MYHFSLYSQIFPIIIPQPQSYAISLTSNQIQYHQQRTNRNRKMSNPANRSISNSKQTEAQRTALKAGLQKSLDTNNRGFEILKKMGYEEGKPLGKTGSGIIEPLSIPLKNNPRDRAGLGRETKTATTKNQQIKCEPKTTIECSTVTKTQTTLITTTIKKENVTKSVPVNRSSKKGKHLLQLQTEYREDIELLRLRMQAELSVKSKCSESIIIAQVAITGESICAEIFEIIHQYLVNSLHVYTGNPFPMFHDIALVDGEIKVICGDKPSFEYLSSCIRALKSNLSLPITTIRIPPMGSNLYWFAVQMQGLVNGPQSFLTQIKKHRLDLKTDRWIIVMQQPCLKKNKTNLQIITDEHSAMLLIYRYSLKLFVCMQDMDFELQGKFPFAN